MTVIRRAAVLSLAYRRRRRAQFRSTSPNTRQTTTRQQPQRNPAQPEAKQKQSTTHNTTQYSTEIAGNEVAEFSHDPSQRSAAVRMKKLAQLKRGPNRSIHTQGIAATKTWNRCTVGGQFSRMKKGQNNSFSQEK